MTEQRRGFEPGRSRARRRDARCVVAVARGSCVVAVVGVP